MPHDSPYASLQLEPSTTRPTMADQLAELLEDEDAVSINERNRKASKWTQLAEDDKDRQRNYRRALAQRKGWDRRKAGQINEQDRDILRYVVQFPYCTTRHVLAAFKGKTWGSADEEHSIASLSGMDHRLRLLERCGCVIPDKNVVPKVWRATGKGVRETGLTCSAPHPTNGFYANVQNQHIINWVGAMLYSGQLDVLNFDDKMVVDFEKLPVAGRPINERDGSSYKLRPVFTPPAKPADQKLGSLIVSEQQIRSALESLRNGSSGRANEPYHEDYSARYACLKAFTMTDFNFATVEPNEPWSTWMARNGWESKPDRRRQEMNLFAAEREYWFRLEKQGIEADATATPANAWLYAGLTQSHWRFPDMVIAQPPKVAKGNANRVGKSIAVEIERGAMKREDNLKAIMDNYSRNGEVYGGVVWLVTSQAMMGRLIVVCGGDATKPAASDYNGVYKGLRFKIVPLFNLEGERVSGKHVLSL